MKYATPFLALLTAGLLAANASYAAISVEIPYKHNGSPQTKTATFNLAQNGGDVIDFSFSNSSLPAHFLCFFNASTANLDASSVNVVITSDDSIDPIPGTDLTMKLANDDKPSFSISHVGNSAVGHVYFTLKGNMNTLANKTISITCTMSKY